MDAFCPHLLGPPTASAAWGCEGSDPLDAARGALHMAGPAKSTAVEDGCHIMEAKFEE